MTKQANPDLMIALDRADRRGLRAQIERELRGAIQSGRLTAGTALPASRALALDLGVSRSVVVEAYGHLTADGYLEARQGFGTRVRAGCRSAGSGDEPAPGAQPAPIARFLGGLPDPECFPRRTWQRHYRAALNALPDPELGYPGPQGVLPLREALAAYVGRVRGVVTTPSRMLITGGFTQALALACRALRARGVRSMAVEDPCFGLHREVIAAAGLRPVPIAVDDEGIDVAALDGCGAAAVLVAPAHSYPTGAVLSAVRRRALLEWAARSDALVIEDDYDAEFRYDRAPIAALQGLAPEYVLYAGCASKTLTPAVRLGWVAAPASIAGDLMREKALDDMGSALLEQLALARLVASGDFARHLRRMRPVYRRRRDVALDALAAHLPDAVASGVAAGLHVFVRLPAGASEAALVDAARERRVLVEGAAWHWADRRAAPPALVVGYGCVSEPALRRGIAVLGEVAAGL